MSDVRKHRLAWRGQEAVVVGILLIATGALAHDELTSRVAEWVAVVIIVVGGLASIGGAIAIVRASAGRPAWVRDERLRDLAVRSCALAFFATLAFQWILIVAEATGSIGGPWNDLPATALMSIWIGLLTQVTSFRMLAGPVDDDAPDDDAPDDQQVEESA